MVGKDRNEHRVCLGKFAFLTVGQYCFLHPVDFQEIRAFPLFKNKTVFVAL